MPLCFNMFILTLSFRFQILNLGERFWWWREWRNTFQKTPVWIMHQFSYWQIEPSVRTETNWSYLFQGLMLTKRTCDKLVFCLVSSIADTPMLLINSCISLQANIILVMDCTNFSPISWLEYILKKDQCSISIYTLWIYCYS